MKFNSSDFNSLFPSNVHQVTDELLKRGFIPILVGGTVRDYLLTGEIGSDLDMELSHETLAFNPKDWKDMGKDLSRFGRVSFLPYEVIKLDLGGRTLEFSPPRLEVYREDSRGHSNFDAHFDFSLPFEEAVSRRDFTINAMGIRFEHNKKFTFLDPLKGEEDLRLKLLRPAGENFSKDPVRTIRAYRFGIKFALEFSEALKEKIKVSHPEEVTHSYFWSEMQKSGNPLRFLEKMIELKKDHPSMRLPVEENFEIKELSKILFEPSSQDGWLIALQWGGYSAELWCKFFCLSSETCARLIRWVENSKKFLTIMPEEFHGEFEEVRESENFLKLFDWYFSTKQLLQKNPEMPLMRMIKEFIPEWIYLFQFEAPKDVKHIDPPFRAKYQVWNLCQRL